MDAGVTPWRWVRKAWARRPLWPGPHDRLHFVRDYRRLVRRLLAEHPYDEAMSLAVGGAYEEMGAKLAEAMIAWGGLENGMSLVDLGCGSGRFAHALAARVDLDYLGLDVTPEVLAYARRRCPPAYRFRLSRGYRLPCADTAVDRIAAFSVFTHLLHEESFLYLRDAWRVLKPGGAVVFTFLEFGDPAQWSVFAHTADATANGVRGPINVFLEEPVIRTWADHLGFEPPRIVRELGQSLAVLHKPMARPELQRPEMTPN